MVRGTRVMMGEEAARYSILLERYRQIALAAGYQEIILPALWEQETFVKKAGEEILGQMYAFNDKGDRPICLIPEATAVIQELYKDGPGKALPKPVRWFYIARCYRYERPQAGRYREFTQFGVECLGGQGRKNFDDRAEVLALLETCMKASVGYYSINDAVKRGLDYYVEDGFEVECQELGAQKQVAGGGRYETGIGFAIGVDRILLAQETQAKEAAK